MVLLWIGFNDLLPLWLKSRDGTAHWAHLGGFLTGMGFALILLLCRLINARGSDLISTVLGRHAWPILGSPASWANREAPLSKLW